MSGDTPLFANTEDAMRYGRDLRRVIGRDEFQTLVRTWMAAQIAFDNAELNPQSMLNLAYRVQTLREAVRGFLFDDELAPGGSASPRTISNALGDRVPPKEALALEVGCA